MLKKLRHCEKKGSVVAMHWPELLLEENLEHLYRLIHTQTLPKGFAYWCCLGCVLNLLWFHNKPLQ